MKVQLHLAVLRLEPESDLSPVPVRVRVEQLELELAAGATLDHTRTPVIAGTEPEPVFAPLDRRAGACLRPPRVEPGRRAHAVEDRVGQCLDEYIVDDVGHERFGNGTSTLARPAPPVNTRPSHELRNASIGEMARARRAPTYVVPTAIPMTTSATAES